MVLSEASPGVGTTRCTLQDAVLLQGSMQSCPKQGNLKYRGGLGTLPVPSRVGRKHSSPPEGVLAQAAPCSPLASSGIWPRLPKPHISTPSPSYCHNCFCSPSAFALLETHPLPLLPLNVSYIQPRKFSGVPRG